MGTTMEGVIEIPGEEFWEFVSKWYPRGFEVRCGVPRWNKDNNTLEIDFAADDTTNPENWAKKPACMKQWDKE